MQTNKNTHQASSLCAQKTHSPTSQFFTDLKRALSITLLITLLSPTADVVTAFASTYDSTTATAFDTIEDAGSGETRYALRFGTTLQKELAYDTTLSRFVFGSGLNVKGTISGTNLTIVGTTPSYIVGRTTIGSTRQYQTGATLTVERSSFTGAVNTGTKATLFSTDQMALGQLEGGAYFGRVGLKENQWGLSNYGNTWTAKGSSLSWNGIAMSSDGRVQTAGGASTNIYVSLDYGNTWTAKDSSRNWKKFAMSSDGKFQLAGVNGSSFYASGDYGNTWTAYNKSASAYWGVAMSSDGQIQAVASNVGIFESTNFGKTWSLKSSAINYWAIAMSSDGKIQTAVTTSSDTLYVSTNYGTTWVQRGPSLSSWQGIAMSSDGKFQTAIASAQNIYVSSDYGSTWSTKGSSDNWRGVAMSSDGKIQAAVTLANLYVSINYGQTWVSKGISINTAIAMSSDGKIMTSIDTSPGYIYVSYADSSIFGNVAIGTGSAKAMLDVHGTMSSAVLVVSGNASVTGALLTKGTITSRSTVSGANLTFMGATSSYILGNLGVGTTAPQTKLEVLGTISGTTLNANTLLTGSTIQGFGFYDCQGTSNKITYNSTTKKFLCEADQGGAGAGPWSNTGSIMSAFDLQYVKKSGDTMTGALTIQPTVSFMTAFKLVGSGSYTIAALSGGSIIHTARGNNVIVGGVKHDTDLAGAYSVAVAGHYAYVANRTNNSLRIIDISNPTTPTIVGGINDDINLEGASSVAVAGRYAYVANFLDNSLRIIDVSNPFSPSVVGGVKDDTNLAGAFSVAVAGRYAYVTAYSDNSLRIIDISNPAVPTIVGGIKNDVDLATARSVAVAGRYAYVTNYTDDSLRIIDVSTPTAPVIVGGVKDASNLNGATSVTVAGRYAYVANYIDDSLRIIDVSNPTTTSTIVGGVTDATNLNGATSVAVAGRYAYVATNIDKSLRIIDISNPASPVIVGGVKDDTNLSATRSVAVVGRYAYMANSTDNSLRIIDLNGFSTPTASFGALDLGTLDVLGDARFNKNVTIDRGLNIGDGLYVFGQTSMRAYSGSALTLSTQDKNGAPALNVIGGISGTTLNANTLLTGALIQGFGLYGCQGSTNKLTYNAVTKKFLCEADQVGASGLSQADADARYVKLSGGTMTGTLNVDVTTGDIVKTTSGTLLATDFGKTGSTVSNIESTNDLLDMRIGVVPNAGQGTMASSSLNLPGKIQYGSHSIVRSDGKIVIMQGLGTLDAFLWDGLSLSMSSTTRNPLVSGGVGSGAISLKKPDGRYIVIAGGSTTTTGIFDPYGGAGTSAGPAVCTTGAGLGTNAALIASGSYLVLCGGTTNWGILNSNSNTYSAGTALTVGFGTGAMTIGLDDGRFLVFAGKGTSTHWIFNPNVPAVQSWSVINPITSNAPTISVGAFAYRRSDGRFVIVGGAQNASTIYDPTPTASNNYGTFTAQSGAGYGPTATLSDGAGAVYRQDGKLLLMVGGSTTTNIIDRSKTDAGQFTAGPTITGGTPGQGSHMVMNARGQYQIFMGGASISTGTYDMGYIIGGNSTVTSTGAIYESECISLSASMNSGATLNWNTNAEDQKMIFKVRTGNGSCPSTEASYKTIVDNGGLIRPTAGDNRVQMKVIFARGAPVQADQEWGLRRGLSQVLYRSIFKDPALYDISIKNSSAFHRTQFDFGTSKDASGPMAINIANDKNRSMQIQLANTATYPSTYNVQSAGSHLFNGAFGSGTALTTASTVGTIVLRKPNGTYVIISGGGVAFNAQLFNTLTNSISALGTTPTALTGTGAFAFKRPDGKFLIGIGKDSRTTNIYDPATDTFTAGPNMVDRVGEGSMVIPMSNGRVLIVHGGYKRTSTIYDPFLNVTYTGATMLANVGRGAMAIPKPDGQYLIVPGTSTVTCTTQLTTFLYDPLTNGFRSNPGVAFTTTGTGPGAVAVERDDGNWMIFKGGATTNTCAVVTASTIYNPVANTMAGGPTVVGNRLGSTALQRPDGRWLIINANATSATQIYEEKTGAFTTGVNAPVGSVIVGPNISNRSGTGSVALQLDNGKYFVTLGAYSAGLASTTATNLADLGWVSDGYYRSEVITIPDLDSTSTLSWHQTPAYGGVSAHVRTGTSALMLAVNPGREIPYSGAPINPLSGETNIQINFSLKRSVPPNPGIMEDVWYNGGTVPPYRRRTFATPTITDFSIGKDTDLVNLKADKNSLFRVNSNGDVYTGTKGALYSGGADLAERYLSKDDLTPGELVSIDFTNNHSVKRATKPYQMELLGVVSTAPGFVAGAYTKDSFPIALVGRVPVKVSLENGSITAGDYLTSSLIPGYAMRAVKAGRVVGVALESSQDTSAKLCSKSSKAKCTTVMMFVNLTDWPGPQSDDE